MPSSDRGVVPEPTRLAQGAQGQDQPAGSDHARSDQTEIAQPKAPTASIAQEIAALRTEIERGTRNEITETGETYTERDLNAQEAMAFWALVMAVAAVLTFLVSAYVAVVVRKTLGATAEAANHAKTMADEATKATGAAISAAKAGREANQIALNQYKAGFKPLIRIDVNGPYLLDVEMIAGFVGNEKQRDVELVADVFVTNAGDRPFTITRSHAKVLNTDHWPPVNTHRLMFEGETFRLPQHEGLNRSPDWPNYVGQFKLTRENRVDFMMKPPQLVGFIQYVDTLGVKRERGFGFRPASSRGGGWFQWGGDEYNYEREIE